MSTEERPEIKDYREDTDIARVHSPVSREKDDFATRREYPPAWVIIASAFIFIGGGTYLGAYGGGFNNDMSDPFGAVHYVDNREDKEGVAVKIDIGADVYGSCAGCHNSNGEGNGTTIPPLAGSEWVTGGTKRLAHIIIKGVEGPIRVKGKTYGMEQMQPQGLNAEKLAAVMNYVRNNFGNESTEEVTKAMAQKAIDEVETAPKANPDYLANIPADENLTE